MESPMSPEDRAHDLLKVLIAQLPNTFFSSAQVEVKFGHLNKVEPLSEYELSQATKRDVELLRQWYAHLRLMYSDPEKVIDVK